jgi:hypothetical protein
MTFDIIFGNPPFQKTDTRKKTQHKLWIDFTIKAVNEWLVDGGHLSWITPQSWSSPSSKVLNVFKANDVVSIDLDTRKHFPDMGSTFSNYHIIKSNNSISTSVTKGGSNFDFSFDDSLMYVPSDVCEHSLSIHKKIMFEAKEFLQVNYDYTTCHNVIRHAFVLNQKKINANLVAITKLWPTAGEFDIKAEEKAKKMLDSVHNLISKKQTIDITVSKEETEKHKYPLLHTNRQTWYSSIKQSFHDKKKVMWSRSGYTKPFYDDGKLGCTDMGYYILVESKAEGENLSHNLNLNLFKYIFKTAKWSGFGNELVFTNIPQTPTNKKFTDQEMYDFFNISESEVEYIESLLPPDPKARKSIKASEIKSKERVANNGEVYTPKELVLEMLNQVPANIWEDNTKRIIDPASGNGNFIVQIVNKKLDSGLTPVESVATTFGIDIMQDNVDECHGRIINLLDERGESYDLDEIKEILRTRIVVNNALENTMENIFMEVI